MSASASDISNLRMMVAEPTEATYNDAALTTIIDKYPLDGGAYDLNAAAAEVWGLKAAGYVGMEERVSADGASFDYGALMEKALRMEKFYKARASSSYASYGTTTVMRTDVDPTGLGWY